MKIHLTKHAMTRQCQPDQLAQMQSAGWQEVPADTKKAPEDIIRLKPPVRIKATETALAEANITTKGDE